MKSLFLSFIVLLGACCCQEIAPQTQEKEKITLFQGNIMTIDYRIIVGSLLTSSDKNSLEKTIVDTFIEVNNIYNKWNPNSEISTLNRLPANQKISLSHQLADFLGQTDQIVKLTEGLFDPTIEPLQRLWKKKLEMGKTPENSEIEDLMPAIGWDKIHIENNMFSKEHSLTQLDLGGIAKGYCVDLLVERLNQKGYPNIFVEWGGEIRTSGRHPDNRPWNIFISRMGDSRPENAIATLGLEDTAIATSGDYLQNWTIKGKNGDNIIYFHVIDPRTHKPAEATYESIASVSVLCPSCALADGIATALMLFSSVERGQEWAESLKKKIPTISFWIESRQTLKESLNDQNHHF